MNPIAPPVLPGETLANKYKIERVLGHGGMGVVVAAYHLELEHQVAIKFLLGDASSNAIQRFTREAKAAALVKSEHVCRIYDFGRLDSGEPYIVMEYLEGRDLAEKLDSDGPQPVADAVGWIIQACDALASAHAKGVVHRDLKPANLFLQESSEGASSIKVLDFGISKLSSSRALTNTAAMIGSPLYMSPEQLESSRDVDARSDVWSIGVVLYELLTGEPPFAADSLVQVAVKVREQEPEPASKLRPEVPAAIDAVISKALAKRAEDRYEGVRALMVDLGPFAPVDVASILAKHAKPASAPRASDPQLDSHPALALSETVSTDERPRLLLEPRSDASGRSDALDRRTLDPVQTTPVRTRARRVFLAVAAMGVLSVVTIGMLSTPRRPAGGAATEDVDEPRPEPAVTPALEPPASEAPTVAAPTPASSIEPAERSAPPVAGSATGQAPEGPAPQAAPSAERNVLKRVPRSAPKPSSAPAPKPTVDPDDLNIRK